MNISYHAWKDFSLCPKKYFLRYRRNAEPTVLQNDYFKLYGLLTEKFFTLFCNKWRYALPYMPAEEIEFKLKALWQEVQSSTVVDWNAPYAKKSPDEVFQKSFEDICAIMNSEKQNYFLSTDSEVDISVGTKNGVNTTCRIDFIHQDPNGGVLIIDGKGSSKIGKNVDKDQLLFYALMYFFHYKKWPDGLGFFYYQFNTFVPVMFTLDIMNTFRATISSDIKKILTESEFPAKPSSKACKYCDWKNSCEEHIKRTAERRKPSKVKAPDTIGVCDFGF